MEINDRSVYLARLLEWAREKRALYLHAQVNEPFRVRAGGKLETVPPAIFPELDEREMLAGLEEFFGEEFRFKLDTEKEIDFIFSFNDYRYRAHFGRQQEKLYFSIRAVPSQMFRLKDLQLPVSMRQMARDPHGLILFAGPSGHGKGNSARAALQELIDAMELRVITIEDPIKYVIPKGKCQLLQREVGIDVDSTADGLRSAMRENPDVIFVNDLPDPESIDLALTAADRGILVIGIVTARSTWEAIDRLRESFDAGQQANFDARFARAFNAIYFQRMIPNMAQGRTPCVEICRWSQEIARCIKENTLNKLTAYIEASNDEGMHTYDQYLIELHVAGVISRRIVQEYCLNRTYVDRVFEKAKKPKPIKGGRGMSWRLLFLTVGPVAFAYYLHKAGQTADSVTDADVFAAFVNLIIAFPFGLITAWAYASQIGDWFGGAVWSQHVEEPDSDHPHWLVTLTGKLEHGKRYFLQRWICFLATQLTTYTGWAILYRRGMNAAKPGTWMERYFATCLYPFPNAFDAMKAAEVLQRNGIDPKAHPDPQVALFILRAEMPDRASKEPPPSVLPGDLEPVSEPEVQASENPKRKKKSNPGLMRNRAIALFEGAEPGGPVWKTHGREAKELVGSPYGDRRATTILFTTPSPPPTPFKPVRLPNQRRNRV